MRTQRPSLVQTKVRDVLHVPTRRTTFHTRCFLVSKTFGWFVFLQSHVTQQCCFFCCLTAGAIWACLQNHQTSLWELFAVPGCTGPTKWGEQPETFLSEWVHRTNYGTVNSCRLTGRTITTSRGEAVACLCFHLHCCIIQSHGLVGKSSNCRLVVSKTSNDGFVKKATTYKIKTKQLTNVFSTCNKCIAFYNKHYNTLHIMVLDEMHVWQSIHEY